MREIKFYFTFGSGHHDTKGRSLLGWYTIIAAKDEVEARVKYFDKFGDKWAFTYTEAAFEGQVEKYNLQYEPFELLDLCCQVPQDKYIELKAKIEEL